jgi:hypothetical protein
VEEMENGGDGEVEEMETGRWEPDEDREADGSASSVP